MADTQGFDQTQLAAFAEAGDELAEAGKYRDAMREYARAWQLVPEPKVKHPTAVWILAAIADAAYLGGFHSAAWEALDQAALCPEAMGNALLHLRRGQLLFERRDFDEAADELMRAYRAGGREVFAREHDKYLRLLRGAID